jgi:hypothetical protein
MLTRENRSTRRKTCSSAFLSTKNPTRNGLGLNPGLRCERPGTNYVSLEFITGLQVAIKKS